VEVLAEIPTFTETLADLQGAISGRRR